MLDFKWKNGQAPSLNASNMQLITDAINSNEAKIKDVESAVAEIVIEHGGSIVVANPEEEPTEMLNTVKINNDVFELGASGDTGIEVTQEVYNALEEAGEIEADVNYFITDGERRDLLIDDSKTGLNNAWSAHKVNGELDDLKASLNNVEETTVAISFLKNVANLIKRNGVVEFIYTSDALPVANASLGNVGTLPVGYRPAKTISFTAYRGTGIDLYFNPDGSITAYNYDGQKTANTVCRYHETYIASN